MTELIVIAHAVVFLLVLFAVTAGIVALASRAYRRSVRPSTHRHYTPYGGAREIARRKRQLERGIVRCN